MARNFIGIGNPLAGGGRIPSSSSGRYHGGSSGNYHGSSNGSVSYRPKPARPAKPAAPSYGAASGRGSNSGKNTYLASRPSSGRGSYSKPNPPKGVPAYIAKNGAVFDAYFNHIPTEKVPVYVKGPAWSADKLISYTSRNDYGDYSDNVYDSLYDEIKIGGSSGGYKPAFDLNLNPYKEMLSEMEKLRRENLELGKKALNDEAGDHYRQAYINHQRSLNSLPEMLYKSGSTGGITESTRAYMDSAYKNAINDIEKNKLNNIGRLQADFMEQSSKEHADTMDKIMKQMERLESEKRTYERMLEERLYREKKEERDYRRKLYEKYYGI